MTYGTEAGPNCRLTLWLIAHDNTGTAIPDANQPTLAQVYNGLPLWDPAAGSLNGLLNLLKDRVQRASTTNDNDIVDPGNPAGTPYIKPKKAARIVKLIDNYVDDNQSTSSFTLKFSDLFEGSALSTNGQLRDLLLQFKRIGFYWPSNHCKDEDRPQIAAVLKSAQFWGVPLLSASAAPTLGNTTHKTLFDTAMSALSAESRAALRFLRDFGVTRHHPAKPHAANPKDPGLATLGISHLTGAMTVLSDHQVGIMTTGNGRCCNSGACAQSIYPYKYCQTTSTGACSAMSDECP